MSKSSWSLAALLTAVLVVSATQSLLSPKANNTGVSGETGEYIGHVLKPDGSPASGARVGIVVQHASMFEEILYTTKTAEDGSFRLLVPQSTFNELRAIHETVSLVATKEGYGIAWKDAIVFMPKDQRLDIPIHESPVLKLAVDDAPVTGRVVHSDGTPASHIRVELVSLQANETEDLDPWLKAVGEGQTYQKIEYQRLLPRRLSGLGLQRFFVITGEDGRFQFSGLGRNRLAAFQIAGPNVACMIAVVRTANGERLPVRGLPYLIETQGCFGRDFTVTAQSSRSVKGVVTDAESGHPLAGVVVRSVGFGEASAFFAISTVTDDLGQFELEGFPIGDNNRLVAVTQSDIAYVPVAASVNTDVEASPLLELKMRQGLWVEGTVTEKNSGQPVLATVCAFIPTTNPHLANFPLLTKFSIPSTMFFRTDGQGRYRIPTIPGRNVICARLIGRPSISDPGNDRLSKNIVLQYGHQYRCLNLSNLNLEGVGDNEESRMWIFQVVPWPLESGIYHQLQSVDIPDSGSPFHLNLTVE